MATKSDFAVLKPDLATLEPKPTAEVRTSIAELRAELIKWVVGIAFAPVATILAISAHPGTSARGARRRQIHPRQARGVRGPGVR